jgi:TM2 domain
MKSKTLAAWLSFVLGPFGAHRFYLHGKRDALAWLLPLPTLLGLYGVQRARALGLDDPICWLLIPFAGFTIAGCALNAIVMALQTPEKWNARHNPEAAADASAGQTSWATIGAIVCALLVGTTVLMSSLAFSFQRYFESQIEAAQKLSQ